MAKYRLSRQAFADLSGIADYTFEMFGELQSERYADSLRECFEMLANDRLMGRDVNDLSAGLRAFKHQSHIVYYLPTDVEILIVRVLHQSMDARSHL